MKFALVLLLSFGLSGLAVEKAWAADKKSAAKTAAKAPAKSAAKRGPASAATPKPPAKNAPRAPSSQQGQFEFQQRVIGGKTVVCGYVYGSYGTSMSCVAVDGVAN